MCKLNNKKIKNVAKLGILGYMELCHNHWHCFDFKCLGCIIIFVTQSRGCLPFNKN